MAGIRSSLPGRDAIEKAFEQISQVAHASLRPLPTQTGDYSYLSEDKAQSNILAQLKQLKIQDLGTLRDLAFTGISGEGVNDKNYLMERMIQLAAELPLNSRSGTDLSNNFLKQLWTDLRHPPASYLGNDYVFRTADGSNNNTMFPRIGVAGAAYARTVKPEILTPIARPDPGVIFDTIMVRKTFRPHPNGISSVLFYLASVIIHDIFHTSHTDFNVSETSSYLDLAPLYGSSQAQQNAMRTFKGGKLKPDCFSDKRVLGFPPGVGLLLIMFNRFHNYVVEQLALIDEQGRFSRILTPAHGPVPSDAGARYDNALFQVGRLITGGLYVNVILKGKLLDGLLSSGERSPSGTSFVPR